MNGTMFDDSYRHLAAAILHQAVLDRNRTFVATTCVDCGNKARGLMPPKKCGNCGSATLDCKRVSHRELGRFVESDWCKDLCDGLDLHHETYRARFLSQPVSAGI